MRRVGCEEGDKNRYEEDGMRARVTLQEVALG